MGIGRIRNYPLLTIRQVFVIFIFIALFCWSTDAAPPGSGKGIEQYIYKTVKQPVMDGVDQSLPGISATQPGAIYGFIDVTKAPFNADPNGKVDSTLALQNAINYARDHQLVCMFPTGTYLVSDTLRCIQNYYRRSNGHIYGARFYPCQLIGSKAGRRPKILLGSNSPGYGDPDNPKRVIEFLARKANPYILSPHNFSSAISFNQMLVNIDIEISDGNSGAVGVYHYSAQGSAIQDCTIDASYGYTGVEGGCGAGGSFSNVTVIGGRIGMDLRLTDVAPTITGIRLYGQTEHAVVYRGMNTLTAVGLHIIYAGTGAAIQSLQAPCCPFRGPMSIIDAIIECEQYESRAIGAANSVYLNNVYIKNAKTAVYSQTKSAQGQRNVTVHIKTYIDSGKPFTLKPKLRNLPYSMPIYHDGHVKKKFAPVVVQNAILPTDIVERHLWREPFPHFQSPGAVNVKLPPYNAKGDGNYDDSDVLQKAIDENEIVFLPKGYYRVKKTIFLKKNTKLVGIGRHLSLVMADPDNASFEKIDSQPTVLMTANDADAETIIYHVGIFIPSETPHVGALHWRSGPKSVVRDINILDYPGQGFHLKKVPPPRNIPLVIISGFGGGRIYNLYQDRHQWHTPEYRHVIIRRAKGPLNFYQLNTERADSEANFEILESENISVFGLKGEGNKPIALIKRSDNIIISGYGGNAAASPGHSLFRIVDSTNISLVNIVDTPRLAGGSDKSSSGIGVHPSKWNMIFWESNGKLMRTGPFERPVLFMLGNPIYLDLPPAAKINAPST